MAKTGKSNKTARVLNLLTDPDAVEESAAGAAEAAAESAKAAGDKQTQDDIRGALEMELAEAAPPARPTRGKHAAGEDALTPTEPASEAEPEPEPPAPEPVFSVSEAPKAGLDAAINELKAVGAANPDEYICYNVTQALVEDKATKYIKMFGLCPCARCRIDVIALALSNLPPKYVVAKPHDLVPRLSLYEQKYNAAVVTQVMSACRKVLDRPHHEREKK